jgi:2-polyprenyl-3-methyl-5-hydroxy-6-metoxy-1,4-benzoquinol methylase
MCQQGRQQCQWSFYSLEQSIGELLDQADCEYTVFVTDPQVLLTPVALHTLIEAMSNGCQICGPVLNQTDFPQQQADLPAPYVNINTYLELVELASVNKAHSQADGLDPVCVICDTHWLRSDSIRNELGLQLPDFVERNSVSSVVSHGALVHRFGQYYQSERDDLIDRIPEWTRTLLDVGCAFGGYGKRLKEIRPDIWLAGVELNPIMADSAKHWYDHVYSHPVEELCSEVSFDLINCGDVLEHLQDPWTMLRTFFELLNPGGRLVTSVPNVGHWSIVRDLLQGRFEYIPVGLLCITHIRWFTEESLRKALQDAGFVIEVLERQQIQPTPQGEQFIADMLSTQHADEQSLRTNEFLIVAVKNAN